MPKIQLKGIIKDVSDVGVIGTNSVKHQIVTILVPGFTDSFGEKRTKDEFWRVNILGDKVTQLDLANHQIIDKKACLEVYINSNHVIRDGEIKSYICANLANLKLWNN